MKTTPRKNLNIFSLVMINVIAVGSLRSLPISAEYGYAIVSYYLIATLLFFIPTALVAAELATGWPEKGGLYVWTRAACGPRFAFFTIWLQWIYNMVWYPTILTFTISTLFYIFNPALAQNKILMLGCVLALLWLSTLANYFGMKQSSLISTLGTVLGTFVPILLIIGFAGYWLLGHHPTQIAFSWHALFPNTQHSDQLPFFAGVLFGLIGMEMSAMHADEVKNPQHNYPKALLISAIIILAMSLLGSLAIAIVVPHNQLNLVTGLMDAFSTFFKTFHLTWMIPITALLIAIESFGCISAWIIGPIKGLLVASHDGMLPKYLQKTNRHQVPTTLLILQAVICSLLCGVFLLFPTINDSYWLLSAMTAQLALCSYIGMFIALVVLRYRAPHITRRFKISGGFCGAWLVASLGIISCLFGIIVGFIPPANLHLHNTTQYEAILIGGIVIFCLPPFLFRRCQ